MSFEKQTLEIFVVFLVFFVVVVFVLWGFCFVYFFLGVVFKRPKNYFSKRNISVYLENHIIYCKVYAHG